jgi:hypothetical protein
MEIKQCWGVPRLLAGIITKLCTAGKIRVTATHLITAGVASEPIIGTNTVSVIGRRPVVIQLGLGGCEDVSQGSSDLLEQSRHCERSVAISYCRINCLEIASSLCSSQ